MTGAKITLRQWSFCLPCPISRSHLWCPLAYPCACSRSPRPLRTDGNPILKTPGNHGHQYPAASSDHGSASLLSVQPVALSPPGSSQVRHASAQTWRQRLSLLFFAREPITPCPSPSCSSHAPQSFHPHHRHMPLAPYPGPSSPGPAPSSTLLVASWATSIVAG